ncbi:glycosyltransferase family 4 protein [Rhodopila sp.]|uniref:glycosyltransferase family 4 protein n=1 Tax=Rhodopila sp. TaxID=2480087 RepID=UPI003D1167E5
MPDWPNRILFVKLGSFSHTNERVLEQLAARFPNCEIVTFDVKDYVKRRFGLAALNFVVEVMTYGPSVLSTASARHAFFFLTPLMFRHLSAVIVNRFGPEADSFRCVLQTQGLFNAALPGRPFVIYTDHTIASHREYRHSDPRLFRSKTLLGLERALYLRADRILTTATHVERTLVNSYGCDPGRVATILIGANVDATASADDLARYAAGRILFVGIEWERKGGPTLLAAFDTVATRFPAATLTIAGCSPQMSHPRARATGLLPRANVAALLADASIFCLPSLIEPSAVASVEAMAFKLPVVATTVGGFPGMVSDGETGLLVPPDDAIALAGALGDLLADPQRTRAMGQAGYRRGHDLFTWDAVGARLHDQLELMPQ